jgi:hypothetical protein
MEIIVMVFPLKPRASIVTLYLLLTACSDVPDGNNEILDYFKANNTTSIPLSVLAKHSVTRVCLIHEYRKVNDVAGGFGFDIPGTIDEGAVGILMMSEKQATVRQISASYFYDPNDDVPACAQGNNIQLKFLPLDPAFKWQDHTDVTRAVRLHMRARFVTD